MGRIDGGFRNMLPRPGRIVVMAEEAREKKNSPLLARCEKALARAKAKNAEFLPDEELMKGRAGILVKWAMATTDMKKRGMYLREAIAWRMVLGQMNKIVDMKDDFSSITDDGIKEIAVKIRALLLEAGESEGAEKIRNIYHLNPDSGKNGNWNGGESAVGPSNSGNGAKMDFANLAIIESKIKDPVAGS